MSPVDDYNARLSEWAVVFPPTHPGISGLVDAEQMTELESALQALRETRRPISDTDRLAVITALPVLLHALSPPEWKLWIEQEKERGAR